MEKLIKLAMVGAATYLAYRSGKIVGQVKMGIDVLKVINKKVSKPPHKNVVERNPEELVYETLDEAEEVLSKLIAAIDKYGHASIADLYDLVGITSKFTDNKYGWTDLRTAGTIRVRGGYMLNLPQEGYLK